jgi:hypothetical protein
MRVLITLAAITAFRVSLAQGNLGSINGRIHDITGAAIAEAEAELRLEKIRSEALRGKTDASGAYAFHGLSAGDYTLRFFRPGFKWLTVKSIHLMEGENRSLADMELSVADFAWCPGRAVLEYVRLLPTPVRSGSLAGTVRVYPGPSIVNSPPLNGAKVVLLCTGGTPCGTAKTDVQGQFVFTNAPQGEHAIRVSRPGFYTETEPGYSAVSGREMVYAPIFLEKCYKGNCDAAKRPKRPLAVCE